MVLYFHAAGDSVCSCLFTLRPDERVLTEHNTETLALVFFHLLHFLSLVTGQQCHTTWVILTEQTGSVSATKARIHTARAQRQTHERTG